MGDIELQFPKVSFVRQYGWVMTAYAAAIFPTGNEAAGLSEGTWQLAPHLLTDLALGRFGVQLNGALEMSLEGDVVSELRGSLAYTIEISHEQDTFLSPLVELDAAVPIAAEEEASLLAVCGVKVAVRGWHLGAGVRLPIAGERPFDFEAMLQVGYHVSWSGRAGDKSPALTVPERRAPMLVER